MPTNPDQLRWGRLDFFYVGSPISIAPTSAKPAFPIKLVEEVGLRLYGLCCVAGQASPSGLTLEREGNRLARCPLLFQGKTWALARVVSIIYRRARRSLPAADVIICVRSSCRAKGKKTSSPYGDRSWTVLCRPFFAGKGAHAGPDRTEHNPIRRRGAICVDCVLGIRCTVLPNAKGVPDVPESRSVASWPEQSILE
jgi:hypothetical protein